MLNDTMQNYDPGTTAAGWICAGCGMWVNAGLFHYCPSLPVPSDQIFIYQTPPDHTLLLTEIKGLLERLIELLAPTE